MPGRGADAGRESGGVAEGGCDRGEPAVFGWEVDATGDGR